ncbi:MAG TPA: hypothetical protein VJ805_07525 [Nitrospiraceae bacterium]|nr:hypothetical protein [Nitrospiraceae bacterium]
MRTFLKATFLIGWGAGLFFVEPVQAGVTRISILLTGEGCTVQRQSLADQLNQVPGIVFVDARSVPDHVLIDVADGTATAEQVVNRVNGALGSHSCRAEEMKSCISADVSRIHPAPF